MVTAQVLVVEDERIVAFDLKRRLVKLGYLVPLMAASGEEALALVALQRPDIVLMDIHLAGALDGIDTAIELRQRYQLPVVFLTAYSEEATLSRARTALPYGYLLKPFSERELHATLQIALEHHRKETVLAVTEVRLRQALDSAQILAWECASGDLQLQFCNLGGVPDSQVGEPQHVDWSAFLAQVPPEDQVQIERCLQQMRQHPERAQECEFRRNDGASGQRWLKLHGKAVAGDAESGPRLVGVVQDISEQRRMQERLREAAAAFDCTSEAILILDAEHRLHSANAAFSDIFGYPLAEMLGQVPPVLRPEHQDTALLQTIWQSALATGQWQGELTAFRQNGERLQLWMSLGKLPGGSDSARHYVAVFADISAMRRAEQWLNRLTHYDALTGLPNRVLIMDRVEQAIERAKRSQQPMALLLLDLDQFKRVNETLGYQAGDELLRRVGERLQTALRATDTLGRLGGDEFLVLVEPADPVDGVVLVASKLLEALHPPLLVAGRELNLSASIGIAVFPLDASRCDTLLQAADVAMYAAKDAGRQAYAFYTPAMTARAAHFLQREHELRRALVAGELRLHYQAQVAVNDGQVCGLEALIRWQHPEHGLLGAAEIIPAAEESGLIVEIGAWVLDAACRQMRLWRDAGLQPGRMAINTTVRQLHSANLPALLTELLERYDLEAGALELELTESALQNEERCVATLRELRSRGIAIAIDDFGTGYSCLSSLKHLPIDRVKIDQAFVRDLAENPHDRAIAATILAMGQQLGLQVIAEGVETAAQLQFLREHGCDEAQGYFFSRPIAPEAIPALLRRGCLGQ